MDMRVARRASASSLLNLLAGVAACVSPAGAWADDVYWVGYQNDVLGPNYPDVGSFFHADNWLNYTVPGINDRAIFGSSVQNPNNPTNRPHLLYFGNFNLRIPGQGDQFIPGGDAELGQLEVQSDSWIFDFGSGSGNGASPPVPSTGSLTVGQQTIIGSVPNELATLTVRNGPLNSQSVVQMGTATGSHGTVNVEGDGASWNVGGYIDLGWVGNGTIRVSDGASMYVAGGIGAGIRDATTGRLEVTSGGQFTSDSNLSFGSGHESPSYTARGEVFVSGTNSRLSAPSMSIGSGAASGSGVLTDHALVTLSDSLQVQSAAAGGASLSMDNASVLITGWASVGQGVGPAPGWSGTASLSGGGTQWNTTDYLEIGANGGNGVMELDLGATLNVAAALRVGSSGGAGIIRATSGSNIVAGNSVRVGNGAGSHGQIGLAGVDTTLALSAQSGLTVGTNGGNGWVEVRDGARIEGTGSLSVGSISSEGTVIVTGPKSSIDMNQIYVGFNGGRGTLRITDGARVTSQFIAFPGLFAGVSGSAEIEVRGTGSLLQSDQGILLGSSPTGVATLTVANGATTIVQASAIDVGYDGQGILSVESGSRVFSRLGRVARFAGSTGTATISGNGSSWNIGDGLFIGGQPLTEEGGIASVVVRNDATLSVASTLETWNRGTVDVQQNGRILVGTGDISLVTFGTLEIGSGGVLAGTGTIIGNVFNNGGTISPGHSPGTLTVNGDLQLGAMGILDMELAGPSAGLFDVLNITGAGMLDGILRLNFIDGYIPSSIFSIDIVSAGAGLNGIFRDVQIVGVDPSLVSTTFNDNVFSVHVVPSPGGIALGLFGVFAASARRRRQ